MMKKVILTTDVNTSNLEVKILSKYKNDDFFIKEYKYYLKLLDNIDLLNLIDVIENKRKCLNCDGLDQCRQEIKYHNLDLNSDGIIYVPCHYLIKEKQFEHLYNNLIYTTSKINRKLPTTKDLHKNADRMKVYEYIDKLGGKEVNKGLYLCGGPGIGKTFIVEVLLKKHLDDNLTCAYILLNDFFNEMRALYFSYDRDEKDLFNRTIKRLKNVNVLVIDDISSERLDEITRGEILFPILDYRMQNEKLTHFTSNSNQKNLEAHFAKSSSKADEPIKV